MGEPSPPSLQINSGYSKERPPTQRTVRKRASDSVIEPLDHRPDPPLCDFIDSFYVTLPEYFHLVMVYDVFLYILMIFHIYFCLKSDILSILVGINIHKSS